MKEQHIISGVDGKKLYLEWRICHGLGMKLLKAHPTKALLQKSRLS